MAMAMAEASCSSPPRNPRLSRCGADADGHIPGVQQSQGGLRFQDQVYLLRGIGRHLPWQLQHRNCSGEKENQSIRIYLNGFHK